MGKAVRAVHGASDLALSPLPADVHHGEALARLALAAALGATDDVVPGAAIESAPERAERLVEAITGRAPSPRILERRGRLGDAPACGPLLAQALDPYPAIGATGHAAGISRMRESVKPRVGGHHGTVE